MHAPTTVEAPLDVKDLLQARFLSRMFAHDVSHTTERLVLKGGMAMRVAHGSARHTKDIDLDADHDMDLASVQTCVRRSIKEATGGGWLENVKVSEPKQTHTTARWKIQGTLPQTNTVLHLTVEISFRHHIGAHETVRVPFAGDPSSAAQIPVYNDEVLLLNKVEALLSPNRDAPRDVVDLFILFKAGVTVTPGRLSERLLGPWDACRMQDLWNKLESMDEERFETEVRPNWTLPVGDPHWQDWLSIRLFVGEQIEALMSQEDSESDIAQDKEKDRETAAPATLPHRHVRHR